MPSQYNRGTIVDNALSLAGRSNELKQPCNQWLNFALRDLGLTYRFPELRKIGAQSALPMGQNTVALPTDFGAGMAKMGMIFGPDNKPIEEVNDIEFVINRGIPLPGSVGRPRRYIVDREAGVFRFDMPADQAYPFTPIYFKNPPLLDVSTSDDTKFIWLDDDMIAVHMLIWWIYVFTEDAREDKQEARVRQMLTRWERETQKLGGTSRILPSPSKFKNTSYTGFGNFTGP